VRNLQHEWDGIILGDLSNAVPDLSQQSGVNMLRLTHNYYQICKIDHQRNQQQMIAEVERRREAEKLVEKYQRNTNPSEKNEISYRVSKMQVRA
jgi:mevalonate pyrophosphate decarboxylase